MAHNFIALQSVHVKGNIDDCVKSEQTLAPFSLPLRRVRLDFS